MSILIRGMEMPRNCFLCPLSVLNGERLFCEVTKDEVIRAKRSSCCPLCLVQPHGRLIDADALIAKQEEDAEIFMGSTNYGDKVRYDEAMNAVANIVNAPTVIPADKDGET